MPDPAPITAKKSARAKQPIRSQESASAALRALSIWFRTAARDLPWRRARSGYAALVSEAMLQQTQVSRVCERFVEFMNRFPTVHDLARADEREVLTAWQGLGYYRRARNLHAAAIAIEEFDGRVPSSADKLMTLPGVGRYTAGAIASIAFGQRVPIVDGNVERVLARLFAKTDRAGSASLRTWAWEQASTLLNAAEKPGEVNEALMELGALICTPQAPRCDTCPLARWCAASDRGIARKIPRPKSRIDQTQVHHHAVIIRRGEQILLEQRPDAGLSSCMWQTPTIETTRRLGPAELRRRLSVNVDRLTRRERFEHHTTHRRIAFHVFTATSRARKGTWRRPTDISDLPLSSPQRRIIRMAVDNLIG